MKLSSNTPPWLAFLMGAIIFVAAMQIADLPARIWGDSIQESLPWLNHAIIKTVLIVVAILGGLMATGGRLGQHGYRKPHQWKVWSWVWPGMVIGGISALLIVFSPAEGMRLTRFGGGIAIILSILYSSFSEEMFCRGFIQNLMANLRERKVNMLLARVSIPALTSGLLFGAMHLSTYFAGSDALTTIIVMSSTFVLGVTAGHLVDKSESILPAIIVHIGYNLGGFLASVIANIAIFVVTGRLPTAGG